MEVCSHSCLVGNVRRLMVLSPQPIISHPSAKPSPPLIPDIPDRSCPPSYSAPLEALLTSPLARPRGLSPLKPLDLVIPPNLPAKFDPESAEAKALGRLSKRREVNLRWRFFTRETAKVYPPLGQDKMDELRALATGQVTGETKRKRFWRRRFAEALAVTPILEERDGKVSVLPTVSIASEALVRGRPKIRAEVSEDDMDWINPKNA